MHRNETRPHPYLMSSKKTFLQNLLGRMSIEDKIGQLNLLAGDMDITGVRNSTDLESKILNGQCGALLNVYTPAATRELQEIALQSPLQIPLIFGYDVIHGHRTIFPIPLGLSCSWNLDLIEESARIAAAEAGADGLHWVYSPMVDISWDARWGRVAEGAGEDPWLGSKIAIAMVRGYQGNDLADPGSVMACVKHFALYGAPLGGRDYHTVDMSRRAMEETYFPPYRAAIDAGARTVMTAFNEINGVPASGNRWLLTHLLREEWGFSGWIVTDYAAVFEMKNHGTAGTDADAALQSINAGVDMDMVSELFMIELPELVKSGAISEKKIDAAVMRILESKWELGLFSDPFARCDEDRAKQIFMNPHHREIARQAARESIVLLKNDNRLLPLEKRGIIALIGPLADSRRDMLGCWAAAGDETVAASPLDGLQEAVGSEATVIHARGSGILIGGDDLLKEAICVAESADVIILVLGESWQMNGEAASRADIRLPKCQRSLAKAMLKTGKPCVLVTMSGRPLELSWEDGKFTTMLHAWASGTEGGRALADVIFGGFAPIGKLTIGFPRRVGQLPMSYREKNTGRPFDENTHYSSKYLDVPNDALFPFGHGLTYAAFAYGPVTASAAKMSSGGTITVSAVITNLSDHPATETLQLYLRDLVASVTRPLKELRGFQRITLVAGETRVVSFGITVEDLGFPGPDYQPITEPGDFIAMVGPSSGRVMAVGFTLV
ncbi:MAG: glycoside hydrolase family 3 N-terminal domain-containing protein [Luteolibacter sp.]